MRVRVKLYATLQKYAPPSTEVGEPFHIELNGSTILDLVEQLGIERELAHIVMVNGAQVEDMSQKLESDALVVIFPPIGGG
ncbi:MAG: MoaD/ThiS family protein [Candidatus Thorarchaeota archaeon]|nr:MAG: MoaD/ThiS family protein [Candidatus Thorarchaeota archaeon]